MAVRQRRGVQSSTQGIIQYAQLFEEKGSLQLTKKEWYPFRRSLHCSQVKAFSLNISDGGIMEQSVFFLSSSYYRLDYQTNVISLIRRTNVCSLFVCLLSHLKVWSPVSESRGYAILVCLICLVSGNFPRSVLLLTIHPSSLRPQLQILLLWLLETGYPFERVQYQSLVNILCYCQASRLFIMTSGINLIANPLYKRNGTKSYVHLLRKYGFNPTKEGPFFYGKHIILSSSRARLYLLMINSKGAAPLPAECYWRNVVLKWEKLK